MRYPAFLVATLLVVACGPAPDAPDAGAAWRGTITTEGDSTTVVNESGSVWGGDATLVEEASIGTLEGPEETMLGSVNGIAYDGERILVADTQVPVVRAYDRSGEYLRDIGGPGQGPGEYEDPASVAVDAAGRVLVRDDGRRKIIVYSAEGDYLETYPMTGGLRTGTPMVVGPDGVPYTIVIVETLENDPNDLWILGMRAHGPDGPYGDPIVPPTYEYERGIISARVEGSTSMSGVPFWPQRSWTLTPALDVVSGVATDYRFEVRRHAGGRLVVERRDWSPVPVQPAEAAWYRRRDTASMRGTDPAWTWNGPAIPDTKPPYRQLVAAGTDEVWVVRTGAGERIDPCEDDAEDPMAFYRAPCWRDDSLIDVFGADGRYRGAIAVPDGMSFYPPPRIRGDEVVARVEDDAGTVYVKRYRRLLPAAPRDVG